MQPQRGGRGRSVSSRPTSSFGRQTGADSFATGNRGGGGGGTPSKPWSAGEELRQREEESLRRNAEISEHTKQLMQETQDFLQQKEQWASPRPSSRTGGTAATGTSRPPSRSATAGGRRSPPDTSGQGRNRPQTVGTGARRRVPLAAKPQPPSAPGTVRKKPPRPSHSAGRDSVTGSGGIGLTLAAARHAAADPDDTDENPSASVMDEAATVLADDASEEIAGGAITRLLKARVVVLQEELQAMAVANAAKDNKLKQLDEAMKVATDEKAQLARQLQAAKIQYDKQVQASDTAKQKATNLEKQLAAVRKDNESAQTTIKQLRASQAALEVRLNRALEEVERSKSSMQSRSSQAKESSEHNRQLTEQLQAQAKLHEKQKADMIAIFKKQQKLIDVLKQQKMHVEAARVLEFSEKEFINLLDWGSSS